MRWLRRTRKFLYILIILIIILVPLLRSNTFWQWTLGYLSFSLPGEISSEKVSVDLLSGFIQVQNLNYQKDQKTLLKIGRGELNLTYAYLLRGLFGIKNLTLEDVVWNKAEKTTSKLGLENIFRFILKYLVIEEINISHSQLNFSENHFLKIPEIKMSYLKKWFSYHHTQLGIPSIQLTHKTKTIEINNIHYDALTHFKAFTDSPYIFSEAKGNLKIADIVFNQQSLGQVDSQLNINGPQFQLQNTTWQAPFGAILIDLTYQKSDQTLGLSIKSKNKIDPKQIPRLSKYVKRMVHHFDFNFSTQLKNLQPKNLDGNLQLKMNTDGNFADPKDSPIALDFSGDIEKGLLQIAKFTLKSPETDLQMTGNINLPEKKLNTQVKASKLDVATLIGFITDIKIGGQSKADGTITGDITNPTFKVNHQASNGNYNSLFFGPTQGELSIHNHQLDYKINAQHDFGKINFNLKIVEVFKRALRHVWMDIDASQMEAAHLFNNPFYHGNIATQIKLEVFPNKNKTGSLKIDAQNFKSYSFNLGEVHSQSRIENLRMTFANNTIQPPKSPVIPFNEIVFDFITEQGFNMKSSPIAGVQVTGKYAYANPSIFNVDVLLNNTKLDPLLAMLEYPPLTITTDAKLKMSIGMGLGSQSNIDIQASKFLIPLEEGEIREASPISVRYQNEQFYFDKLYLRSLGENFQITGTYAPLGNIDTRINGKVNLLLLQNFPKYFREASGFANAQLSFRGPATAPTPSGSIEFINAYLKPRTLAASLENINGKMDIQNGNVRFNQWKASINDGELKLDGNIQLTGITPSNYQLKISANEIMLSEPGTYKLILSGDMNLLGPSDRATLSGNVNILEGKYVRNFSIVDNLIKPDNSVYTPPAASIFDSIRLDLQVKSPGELAINNNIAKLFLKSDIHLTGTIKNPAYTGRIDILEGQFNYFNSEFVNAQGHISFRDQSQKPYIDMKAERVFEEFNDNIVITSLIQGFTDNPQLTFRSNPPMDRQDILSLIFTGSYPGQRRTLSGRNLATSVIGSSFTNFFQQPLQQATKLDIFKMEANDPTEEQGSSLVIGKQLTDRLSLEFKTGLNSGSDLRTVEMEYLLFDNVVIRGSSGSHNRFKLDIAFQWKLY